MYDTSHDAAPPARMLKTPALMGVNPKQLKPRKPAMPLYGGFAFFRGLR